MGKTSFDLPICIVAIVVGLAIMIFDWFYGVQAIGWGWAAILFIVGLLMMIIGFLRLLFE